MLSPVSPPKPRFYSPRTNAIGWGMVVVLVWVMLYAFYGTPFYAPFLIQARVHQLHAGMTETEVWETLGVRPRLYSGGGPGKDYRVGYPIPFGYGLGMRWNRSQIPARLNYAILRPPRFFAPPG